MSGSRAKATGVQIELSSLRQLHNGDCGNAFCDTAEAQQRFRLHRLALLDVGDAVAARKNQPPVPGDGQGGPGKVVRLHKREECALDLFESRRRIGGMSARLS
jgi:hypothetical protein